MWGATKKKAEGLPLVGSAAFSSSFFFSSSALVGPAFFFFLLGAEKASARSGNYSSVLAMTPAGTNSADAGVKEVEPPAIMAAKGLSPAGAAVVA